MIKNYDRTNKINNTGQSAFGGTGKVPAEPVKIGDCLQQLMQKIVEPKTEQYQSVCALWDKIVPVNLCPHCKIIEIDAGVVKVQADSPSHLFELRLNSQQLLQQMQKSACGGPRLRIKSLKFVVGQRTKDGCS
jgi:predicted nucleic acid-binding Zn ribbon protein